MPAQQCDELPMGLHSSFGEKHFLHEHHLSSSQKVPIFFKKYTTPVNHNKASICMMQSQLEIRIPF